MTEHCTLTVHTFNPVRPAVDPDPALVAQRTKAARRLVRSLCDPPRTSYSSPACKLDPPYEPLAGTKAYSTAPPPAAAPRTLRSTHPRPAPAPASPRQLPSFSHWIGSPSPSPPPPPPPPRPNKRRASSPQPAPTQGILKKHPRVAGAWSDAPSAAPEGVGRERKRVRVESPRSSEAKAAARRATFGGGGAGPDAGAGPAAGRGPSAGSSRARELVPPTPPSRPVFAKPAPQEEKEEGRREEIEPERPDLARGAIQRCIPYPYTQPARPPRPGEAPNPARQHPARVLHTFVDPLWTPAPILAPLSRTTSTSTTIAQTQTQTQTQGQAHTTSSLPLDSPATLAALAPGRRGAWLLPLSGALPSLAVSRPPSPASFTSAAAASAAARTAPAFPAFFARAPRRRRSSSSAVTTSNASTSSKDAHGHRRLEWTDARLRAVWDCVAQLGAAGGGWGVVRCDAWWPPDEDVVDGEGETHGREEGAAARGGEAGEGGGGGPSAWPAMLRIACPAHLALALRGLLAQVSVSALARAGRRRAGMTRSEEEGRVGEKEQEVEVEREEASTDEEDDDDRFLRGRRLLWVDEEGEPVLIA
ncbi:hypothetical protein JCM9279_006871 [Rhodotorula babjevae]